MSGRSMSSGVIEEEARDVHLASHKVRARGIAKLKVLVMVRVLARFHSLCRPAREFLSGASSAASGVEGRSIRSLKSVVNGHVDRRLHDVAAGRVSGLERSLFDTLVDGRVLVSHTVSQVSRLTA